ncbi:GGDEF domain-containing protein [Novosphingobium huizhouense]|uniref:GGDEF domain-containing protein n=1 Tax=Novosphingobium huizhouense TaxID=2866625 RepID=UPI001CD83F6D|nr:sensor domain-containing diguanylate cyclase [Novosphingobium huizhouense]
MALSGYAGRPAGDLSWPLAALGGATIATVAAIGLVCLVRQRSALRRALAEAQALYRLLAASTSDVVLRVGADGCIAYASPAAARTGLWREGELHGAALAALARPEQRDALAGLIETALDGEAPPVWHEVHLVGAGGKSAWFELRLETLGDDRAVRREAVAILRSIAERKALEDQLAEAGLTDPMTGLSNRRAFVAMLEHHLAEQAGGCIALFDLDHFRALNDRHGHATGDKVLVMFAQLLRSLVRGGDTVARLGGETFGILLPAASVDQAEAVVRRVLTALSGTTRAVDSVIVRVSASAGVARLDGSADDALRSADLAVQMAKAKGRDRLELAPRLRIERHSRW